MMQSFYVRTAALALSVISILILRANLMMTEYLVCWFSVLFNFLFLFGCTQFVYCAFSLY